MSRVLPSLALSLGLLLSGSPVEGSQGSLQLVYTAELRGNLLPCACPVASLGGLARRIGWVDSLREATTNRLLVVDAGSALPRQGQFPLMQQEDFLALHLLHVEAARRIAYDALVASPEGDKPDTGLAWLRPNEARLVERDGLRIVLAAVDERVDPAPAAASISELAPADLIVLLCAGDLHYARSAALTTGAAVVVVSRGACYQEPVWDEGTLFLGPGVDGKYAGLVRLEISPKGTVNAADVSLRRMDPTVPPAPDWQRRVEELVLSIERRRPGALAIGE